MSASIWIVNLVVLASVLGTDLGRREITKHRLLRPALVAAVIVPMYLKHPATAGTGLALELALAGLGLLLGLAAAALLRIRRDPATGQVFTRGGAGYAALWTAVVGPGSPSPMARSTGSATTWAAGCTSSPSPPTR